VSRAAHFRSEVQRTKDRFAADHRDQFAFDRSGAEEFDALARVTDQMRSQAVEEFEGLSGIVFVFADGSAIDYGDDVYAPEEVEGLRKP